VGKLKTSEIIIEKIINLREKGCSISEISLDIGKSKSVVSRYIQGVNILPEYKEILIKKQGGSKVRSEDLWFKSKIDAKIILKKISSRDKLILLIGIYWGEGTKNELNIINGDPVLLRGFINFIKDIGVSKERIKASIRIYDNIDYKTALNFWSNILDLNKDNFFKPEIVGGKKNGKFEFGMCRLRVEKSSKEFKLLISLINNIKEQIMLS
jgi:hypothetical protein